MWKSILGGDEDQQDNILDDQEGLCAISPLQRVYGFAACMVSGVVCMFLCFIVFAKPIKFGLLFTFGNLLAVGSTAFLIGPRHQMTVMLDPGRVVATSLYIGCVAFALICALWIHNKILTVLAIICEVFALIWYTSSYIPFARRMISNVTIHLFDTEI
ncbi:unnamed protein product [Cuscuta campestris]|uniref:Vesicle transport protein n=1 Tax=Cuscuta campestris TaxID=132261 RepID=A0A484KSS6_9ASTE|nr:unnamed protein product [Cuscuta campestris]